MSAPALLVKVLYRRAQSLANLKKSVEAVEGFALASAFASQNAQKLPSKPLTEALETYLAEGETPLDLGERLVEPSFATAILRGSEQKEHTLQVDGALLETIREELQCPLCCSLLWQPTSLPCGHVMCRNCVNRLLDNAFDTMPRCALCRYELSTPRASQTHFDGC